MPRGGSMSPRLIPWLVLVLPAGCEPLDAVDDDLLPETSDPEMVEKTKDDGGTNGAFDYCDGVTPCLVGEGDCDLTTQCDVGLACIDDLGANFGLAWTTDVCAGSHCANGLF